MDRLGSAEAALSGQHEEVVIGRVAYLLHIPNQGIAIIGNAK